MNQSSATRTIVKISFLHQGVRESVDVTAAGTFRVPVTETVSGRLRTSYKDLTASEVVHHPVIRFSDPVITLNTGEKVRVFTGGDGSYLPAMSEGIIEKHDKAENLRRKFLKRKDELKSKLRKVKSSRETVESTATIDQDAPYVGLDEYDFFNDFED